MEGTCGASVAMSILHEVTISPPALSFFAEWGMALTGLTRRMALGVASAIATAPRAFAEDRPLRIVLGVPPGASADAITRIVGEKMGKALGPAGRCRQQDRRRRHRRQHGGEAGGAGRQHALD